MSADVEAMIDRLEIIQRGECLSVASDLRDTQAMLRSLDADAERYRFVRDVPVYDTGLEVADLPYERKDVRLIQGPELDMKIDREREEWKMRRDMQREAARRRTLGERP